MKKSHIIALLVIAAAVAAILSTVSDSSTYATFTKASAKEGEVFHVAGKLNKEKERIYNPQENANLFIFFMTDSEGKEKKVLLNSAPPQDFEKSEQIVVIGKMKGDDFFASSILMKCPSKYNNPKDAVETSKTS
ncbi:MAG TPA: cytochrome c maturation protein CcmE, partial [Bacteroidia bacterium]|nr:cytochrome c maturation protein CcmE [Bacteroidia bacterium]